MAIDDTSDPEQTGVYVVLGAIVIYAILLFVYGRKAGIYVRNISLHPVVARVESWSDAADVVTISEREMSKPRFKRSGVIVTDNFVIVRGFFTFNLLSWNDLVWAYRKSTTRTINFIPVAITNEAILRFYGGDASFPSRKKLVEEILTFAYHRAPWAVFGYNSQLDQLWKKNIRDFTAGVEARREAISSQSAL